MLVDAAHNAQADCPTHSLSIVTVPDFQSIMLPLLRQLNDGQAHHMSDLTDQIADHFTLTEVERVEPLPSGQPRLANRVAWARTYMGRAGLLERVARGTIRITERGRALLAEQPSRIDSGVLSRYPEFVAFRERSAPVHPAVTAAETPEELIEQAHRQLQTALADELLTRIKELSPRFFERLVLDLLVSWWNTTRTQATSHLRPSAAEKPV
jgi:restriction system protein